MRDTGWLAGRQAHSQLCTDSPIQADTQFGWCKTLRNPKLFIVFYWWIATIWQSHVYGFGAMIFQSLSLTNSSIPWYVYLFRLCVCASCTIYIYCGYLALTTRCATRSFSCWWCLRCDWVEGWQYFAVQYVNVSRNEVDWITQETQQQQSITTFFLFSLSVSPFCEKQQPLIEHPRIGHTYLALLSESVISNEMRGFFLPILSLFIRMT